MQTTVTKEIRLKDGSSIPAGAIVDICWPNQERPTRLQCTFGDRVLTLSTNSLPKLGFEAPSMEEMEEIVFDSICPSIFGHNVEPDGWDHEGSPSWLLAMGLI